MKEFQVASSKESRFTSFGNGSTIGCIPFFINGGISTYYPLIGFGCESIVSARVMTAKCGVVEVSERCHLDLLWAIRGARQFFGVVLELCVKTFPFSLLGNPGGSRQLGTYIFRPNQATDVYRVMRKIIADTNHTSAGQVMIAAIPPDLKKQVLLVTQQSFGPAEQITKAFESLVDLVPIKISRRLQHLKHIATTRLDVCSWRL